MDETPILVEKRAGFRVITLNRPARLNAFTEGMHLALKAALDDIEADSGCRALLLTVQSIVSCGTSRNHSTQRSRS